MPAILWIIHARMSVSIALASRAALSSGSFMLDWVVLEPGRESRWKRAVCSLISVGIDIEELLVNLMELVVVAGPAVWVLA